MEISALCVPSHAPFPRSFSSPLRPRLRPRLRPIKLPLTSSAPRRHGISLMCIANSARENPGSEANTAVTFPQIEPAQPTDDSFSQTGVDPAGEKAISGSVHGSVEQKRSAKIHDFCFGIPFGGFIFGGGFIGFLFSRNVAILSTGVLFGGAILALSTCSLKVWRQGKSSLPFILGQAALAAVLAVKNFRMYSLTKKLFPTAFYALFSTAMIFFYSYVMLSGGNPPPKKLKAAATSA